MGRTLSLIVGAAIVAYLSLVSITAESTKDAPQEHWIDLSVPFSPQAPNGDWADPYQEACEEMSIIMVDHFLRGVPLTRDEAASEIVKLTQWEQEQGFSQDVTLSELRDIAEQYYGYEAELSEEVTTEKIKELLRKGHPVIVPSAGRELGNPYFSGEGPWYHMLVVRGYTPWHFITNDPGTKRGEGYTYLPAVLLQAIHDWTGIKEKISSGKKVMLVVKHASP